VSLHRCARHPAAAAVRGCCQACLLEAALARPPAVDPRPAGSFTIQVPLGEGPRASVFLVREEAPAPRLLRLKRWHTPAEAGFIDRYERLTAALDEWDPPATIVRPITAWLETTGCPCVVTDFRQGMPLLESVRSGWLPLAAAVSGLERLQATLEAAHARGLAHGSVVPGNVFSARPDGAPYLLDFGLAVLLGGPGASMDRAASDRDGLRRIRQELEQLSSQRPTPP
jgi:serine/threonine protein kinase